MDKAGAYGIQEWIGYVGIERIEGSFYNVMGMPMQMIYNHLSKIANYEPTPSREQSGSLELSSREGGKRAKRS
jgi:hypothetical protein